MNKIIAILSTGIKTENDVYALKYAIGCIDILTITEEVTNVITKVTNAINAFHKTHATGTY